MSTSTSTVAPTRSSARCAHSSSASALSRSYRRLIVAAATLPGSAGRLGAVLVAVVEDADRVEPRLGQEPPSSATSARVSPGKPTMTLLRAPASGASARTESSSSRNRSVEPNRRIRRSTGSLECWKDRSK